MEAFAAYQATLWAMALMALLFLVQLLVADVAGIRARHRPGTPIDPDPDRFLFRAARAHANTNESIGGFALLAVVAMLSGATPQWVCGLSWLYVAGRVAHMLCYYANLGVARSISFGIALLALFGLGACSLLSLSG